MIVGRGGPTTTKRGHQMALTRKQNFLVDLGSKAKQKPWYYKTHPSPILFPPDPSLRSKIQRALGQHPKDQHVLKRILDLLDGRVCGRTDPDFVDLIGAETYFTQYQADLAA